MNDRNRVGCRTQGREDDEVDQPQNYEGEEGSKDSGKR